MARIVYPLHFEPRFKHASHYIGVTRSDLASRWLAHMRGQGAVLTRYARKAGCRLILARVWKRNVPASFEQRLKAMGGASRLCPVCKRRLASVAQSVHDTAQAD